MKRLFTLIFLFLLLPGCAAPSSAPAAPESSSARADCGTFALSFLTIGKGDAFLLSVPDGAHYLVDTGKAQDFPQIARALRVRGVETLQGIFLTHGHKDHVGSLEPLLQAFPTEAVYYSGRDPVSYDEILPWDLAEAYGSRPVSLEGDEEMDLGGVSARVWLPPRPDPENANNNSLVLMLTHGDIRMLLMGDAEKEEERLLLAEDADLRADLLKLGHHGEDDASTPEFLDRVSPSIGLIAGNEAENPESLDPEISARLKARDIASFYSESTGLGLDFISDGTSITWETLEDRDLPGNLELSFTEVNRKDQSVTLCNAGKTEADLTGAMIYSLRRDEVFFFPEGTRLEPGGTLTVSCTGSPIPGDLIWDNPEVWQKKRDDAYLFDRNLNLLDHVPA